MYAKPGKESQHEHAVKAAGVQRDDFVLGQFRKRCDFGEIGTEVTAVAHRNAHRYADASAIFVAGHFHGAPAGRQQIGEPREIGAERIEVDGNRPVRRDDIPDTLASALARRPRPARSPPR